ncbi:hypothetical protein CRD60_06810 [Bifidobacterium aemilianum]|uniref:Acyltransferase 3 domain-containing protein n=2 Tax=Bifidobacterium aemilianum TaxID=2493120 RepID=A0A366K710_9BIFI|nr:hypothetical protein CRD60_06810 [Bifidobacterium aemilianum]
MFLILVNHHVGHNTFPVSSMPFSKRQFIYFCFESTGTVGVAVFFGISCWFLCSEKQGIPTNFGGGILRSWKRIWILEREVLFYSLILTLFFACYDSPRLTSRLVWKSVFPTATGLWWYVTSYVVFLLFFPLISAGLHGLGRQGHGLLVLSLLLIWGVATCITPIRLFDFNGFSFVGFIYEYVLISYCRWYMKEASARMGWAAVGLGVVIIMGSIIVMHKLYKWTGDPFYRANLLWMHGPFKLPIMLIAFGMILISARVKFTSSYINTLASTTFGIYLIHEYPLMRQWLSQLADIRRFYASTAAPLYSLGICLLVFLACAALDMIRQVLFKITFDRRKGHWFDLLVARFRGSARLQAWRHRLDR